MADQRDKKVTKHSDSHSASLVMVSCVLKPNEKEVDSDSLHRVLYSTLTFKRPFF